MNRNVMKNGWNCFQSRNNNERNVYLLDQSRQPAQQSDVASGFI